MILVTLRIVLAPAARAEVLQTLRSVAGPTRVKAGCVGCWLYRDTENENAVTLVEEWRTWADLERHLGSDDYRKILAVMDSAVEPPGLRFHTIAHSDGFEAVEKARDPGMRMPRGREPWRDTT